MRILAVDDDPSILELIPLLASRVGFPEVTAVASGRDALEVVSTGNLEYGCMILDISMPGMDGIELCARIRELEAYRATPIIMLTAMYERVYIDRAFRAGATDYLTKPFDIIEFGARLKVANELFLARREARHALGSNVTRQLGFRLAEAIPIEGVVGFVERHVFDNYLKTSTRATLAASQLLALKIDGIEEIYTRATPDEFRFVVREIADAVSQIFRPLAGLFTYNGDGVIIVVSGSPTELDARELEAEIQDIMNDKKLKYDSGSSMEIEVSVGNPLQPHQCDIDFVPNLLHRATARAVKRFEAKKNEPRRISIKGTRH